MTITSLMNDNELFGIVFLYNLCYELFDENTPSMMYCYYVDYDKSVVVSTDGKHVYNLSDKKSTGALDCNKDFIKKAGTLEFVFEKTLNKSYVTKKRID